MKKEVFLAIAIGFALGLVITFGIWTANKSLKSLPQPSPTSTDQTLDNPKATPNPTPVSNFQLTISAPDDEAVLATNKVTVTGKTAEKATVVLVYENASQIISADASGNFTADITLVTGYNVILITAFDKLGNSAQSQLTVTYTTAKI